MFKMDGVELTFDSDALELIVDKAIEYKLGARGLRSIVESIMVDMMYDIPGTDTKKLNITRDYALGQIQKAHFETDIVQ